MTIVESLNKNDRTYFLAVFCPIPENTIEPSSVRHSRSYTLITYPFLPKASNTTSTEGQEKKDIRTTLNPRTFAILQTNPGDNPWDLGAVANFKGVMGENWWDWLLPLRYSPICKRPRDTSEYPFGPDVDRLKRDYKLGVPNSRVRPRKKRRA